MLQIESNWQKTLEHNQLTTFEQLWTLEAGWIEKPNKRRGGWSGVSRFILNTSEGNQIPVYLKRQENHVIRTITNPICGILTLKQEFKNILLYQRLKIPTVTPICFGERKEAGAKQAILLIAELQGYHSLEFCIKEWLKNGFPSYEEQFKICSSLADNISLMHHHHISHNCLYPKHVFIKLSEKIEVAFIDLEKSRFRLMQKKASIRDLDTFHRNTHGIPILQRLRFLKMYLGKNFSESNYRSIIRILDKRFLKRKIRDANKCKNKNFLE